MNITRKQFLAYTLLPGLRPRFHALFATGFQHVSYFMALVFATVRLLPSTHPYLNAGNIGRFGILQVLAEAANNLTLSKKNIDQIILFVCVLFGMILIAMQFSILALAFFIAPALAQVSLPPGGFFVTTPEQQNTDMAGMMLDMVFGVPDLFNSCISTGASCRDVEGNAIEASVPDVNWMMEPEVFPMPYHDALHQMFQYYSIGLLVVGFIIMSYFIATIILETAESGTPFGKRFNKVWAPLRFVIAFGLLIPLPGGSGLNSAQFIVLYAAKFGSGFATNGWILFNDQLNANTAQGTRQLMTAQPNPPEVGGLLQFLFTAKTCAEYENNKTPPNPKPVVPYFVDEPFAQGAGVSGPNLEITNNEMYDQVVTFAKGKNQLIIRFGYPDPEKSKDVRGWIRPICGEMIFPFSDPRPVGTGSNNVERGVEAMQRYYLFIIQELWYETFEGNFNSFLNGIYPEGNGKNYPENYYKEYSSTTTSNQNSNPLPDARYKTALQDFYSKDLYNAMNNPGESGLGGVINSSIGAVAEMDKSGRWDVEERLIDLGWAAAGIWYNRIAEMNGSLSTAVLGIPMPNLYPEVMEQVYYRKRSGEEAITFSERFKPTHINNSDMGKEPIDANKALTYYEAFKLWEQDGGVTSTYTAPTGNAFIDIINALFGTSGLFDMRKNTNVHPLAQISGIGKALVEGSIRNLTYAAVGGAGGAIIGNMVSKFVGQTLNIASGFLVTIAMITLTAGFVLFYVIPLLPFIFFFFAFGNWVKAIFEAMIGAPLWALAHLRIDGEGLAGQAATSGYMLVFEIFLRPILMVFGLLASISIFAALVSVLNQIFDLVVANIGGFNVETEFTREAGERSFLDSMRSGIDELFYTIIYAILVYMIGMSCFKLIDQIPSQLLRYMGQNVKAFNEENAAEGLVGTTFTGVQ